MLRLFALVFAGTLLVGCSDPTDKFAVPDRPEPASWGALQKLTSEDVWMGLDMNASQGNWAGFTKAVTGKEFKAAVDAFATEEIPEKYATAKRKAAKEETVKALQELTRLAESGASGDALSAAYQTVQQRLTETTEP